MERVILIGNDLFSCYLVLTHRFLCLSELVHLEATGRSQASSPTRRITTLITVTHDLRSYNDGAEGGGGSRLRASTQQH